MTEGKIALCHEWLTTYGGSDLTAARIARILDVDDVFTFTADPALVARLFVDRPVHVAHRWGSHPFVQQHWQWLLPLMPLAWSRLDLRSYEVVITSSHSCTNAIRPPSNATHISYCYTPMRYAWEWRLESGRFPWPIRAVWPAVAAGFRAADRRWASRVDHFVAISRYVAERIERYYDRRAAVVYPPVDTSYWSPTEVATDDYFLMAGRLVPYKRPDVVVEAAARAGFPLVVAGFGSELSRLRAMATPNVRFVVAPTNDELRDLYRRTRALIFPGIEDFGLTPVEAQSCGTPVIAFGSGGVRETVIDRVTGLFYEGGSPESLITALRKFEDLNLDRSTIIDNARRFDITIFESAFLDTIRSFLHG